MSDSPRAAPPRRRNALLGPIAIAALVGALVGLGVALADEPTYEATATAIAIDRGEAARAAGSGAVAAGGRLDRRTLELARSLEVSELAASNLGGDVAGADLLADTDFDRAGPAVLEVRSRASSPDVAAAAANAYATAVVELTTILERRRLNRLIDRLDQADAQATEVDPLSGVVEESPELGSEADQAAQRAEAAEQLLAAGPPLRIGAEATLPQDPTSSVSTALLVIGGALLAGLLAAAVLLFGRGRGRPADPGKPVGTAAETHADAIRRP